MTTRKSVEIVFGPCMSEANIRAGLAQSTTPPEGFHNACKGALRTPNGEVYCACPHHAGEIIEVPPTFEAPVEVTTAHKIGHQLSDQLEREGVASLTIPDDADDKKVAALNTRLRQAAKRRALKVKVQRVGNEWVATVKGGIRKDATDG
jgi:hypothetical protein